MQWCPQYRRWTLGVLTWMLALAWGLPQAADAQPTMFETMSGKKREHLELLRMWRLVDKLEIDEEQAMSVFPAFHRQRPALRSPVHFVPRVMGPIMPVTLSSRAAFGPCIH